MESVEGRQLRGLWRALERQKSLRFGDHLSVFSFQEEIIHQVQEMEVNI